MRLRLQLLLLCSTICFFTIASASAQQSKVKLNAYATVKPARDANGNIVSPASSVSSLATFTYNVTSSRDGNAYTGAMVGQDPFASSFSPTNVTTPIIPLIITTNSVAVKISKGGILSTTKRTATFDPTSADSTCLGASNNFDKIPEAPYAEAGRAIEVRSPIQPRLARNQRSGRELSPTTLGIRGQA